ncbi:hypothetical protein PROFUN_08225 [Planoprotostelium fungivorum]|uniref:Cation efflux protein transmembrane domain-containing protein n=1 Tax=Planoprotostelium fungivorum TaxID=1890364 RepID=A0A2P6NK77_9EUKA|nr:hypothetical protein PROFUN_08225 [Planoprotostelium fungivorum]
MQRLAGRCGQVHLSSPPIPLQPFRCRTISNGLSHRLQPLRKFNHHPPRDQEKLTKDHIQTILKSPTSPPLDAANAIQKRNMGFLKNLMRQAREGPFKVMLTVKKTQKEVTIPAIEHKTVGMKAVLTAIFTNAILSVAKFGAFLYTGSGAMLSEAIHSVADTTNQILLYVGIRSSLKAPTKDHPYGYGPEQFVWALISAVSVFFLGSGLSMYHGFSTLWDSNHTVESTGVALSILSISLVLEGGTLGVALLECQKGAKELGMTFRDYINDGPDTSNVAVLLEDAAAVSGVAIAAFCVGMTHWTGNPMWDSLGSISVGAILGATAIFLIRKNKDILNKITNLMKADPVVSHIRDVKAVSIGTNMLRFQADISFNGEEISNLYLQRTVPDIEELQKQLDTPEKLRAYLLKYGDGVIDQLGREVDRIEDNIKRSVPEAVYVDLETDTKQKRVLPDSTSTTN